MDPLFSVVIANYNYGQYLETALRSVFNQTCNDYELIVVDGGSSDNSVEIISKYSNRISWWVSEKDKGQSNAFNKGFAHATGEFITWLNADDLLLPGALEAVKDKLMRTGADWATGNLVRFDMATQKLTEVNWGPHWLPAFMQGDGWPVAVYGPTTFWRRSVFEKLGPMDETCFFAMDTEYWIRLFMHGYKHVRVNAFCWAFGMHEESKTAEFGDHHHQGELLKKKTAEKIRIQVQNGFHVSGIKQRISQLWRLLDGSFIHEKILQRQWTGKSLQEFVQS